jgi:hypothetical protein
MPRYLGWAVSDHDFAVDEVDISNPAAGEL